MSESDRPDTADTALADTHAEAPKRDEPGDKDPMLGRSLAGRYRVETRIGRGGMGLVYEARHETLGKRVAVKVMRRELATNEDSLARFEREAKAAAALSGEHIVDVSDYGLTSDGEAYMVMELLEGQTLEQLLLREGPLPAGRAVAIVRQIAKGLAAAHEGGVIHRDLKTANVFLLARDGRDHVKLLDFGISKLADPGEDEVRLTSTGAVMGTPNYMSPEQARGETDLDHRVDIYSLGVILFETLTGEVPFSGANFLEIAYRVVNRPAPVPSEVRPDAEIPPEVDAIVAKCLAKSRADRFQSAHELMAALPEPSSLPGGWSSGSESLPSMPPRVTAPSGEAPPEPAKRSPVTVVAVLAALVVGGVLTAVYLRGPGADDRAPAEEPGLELQPVGGRGHRPPRADDAAAAAADAGAAEADAASAPLDAAAEADASPRADAGAPRPTVRLEVLPTPELAEVWVGDRLVGTGRQVVEVPEGTDPITIFVKARGYDPREREVVPDESRSIEVTLQRSRTPGGRPPHVGPEEPPGPTELRPSPYPSKGGGDLRPSPYSG